MVDIVDPKTRSRMMSRIRGRDTKIEVKVRKALWKKGFRYRLPKKRGYKGLPGIPDMVFPRYRAVILTNSCFFHGHDCDLFILPSQNRAFWREKIEANRKRDVNFATEREAKGWRTLIIWECALRGARRRSFDEVIALAAEWLRSGTKDKMIMGK